MHRTLSTSEPVQTVGDRCEKYLRTTLSLWYYMEATQQQEKKNKKKSYDQPRQHIKKQRHYFAKKGPSSQGYGLSSGHVWM